MTQDVIFFSVNNWFCGRDYPNTPNFRKWLGNDLNELFRNDKWCKENRLCVYYGMVDMSQNYTISAPIDWVKKNCPELLTDKEYTYYTMVYRPKKKKLFGGYEYEDVREEHKKKYSDFVYEPEEGEETPDNDRVGNMPFREYKEENFGAKYYETDYWDSEDEDEDTD